MLRKMFSSIFTLELFIVLSYASELSYVSFVKQAKSAEFSEFCETFGISDTDLPTHSYESLSNILDPPVCSYAGICLE